MIITCSKCKTQFAVASTAIGAAGKKVRCSHCGNVWLQEPLEKITNVKNIQPPPEKVAQVPKNSNLPVIKKQYKVTIGMGIALAVLTVFAVVLGILSHPGAAPSFSSIFGIKNTEGLFFQNVKVVKERDKNKLKFQIEGDIVNSSEVSMDMTYIVATVYSKGGREMGKYYFEPTQATIMPGEIVHINPELTNVSGSAEHVVLDIGNSWELFFRSAPEITEKDVPVENNSSAPAEENSAKPKDEVKAEDLPKELPNNDKKTEKEENTNPAEATPEPEKSAPAPSEKGHDQPKEPQ